MENRQGNFQKRRVEMKDVMTRYFPGLKKKKKDTNLQDDGASTP